MCFETPQAAAPDYAAANREAIEADFNFLAPRKKVESLSRFGEKGVVDGKEYDFTGMGDADFAKKSAKALLDLNLEYGDKFATQKRSELEALDPEAVQLREKMGRDYLDGSADVADDPANIALRDTMGSQVAERVASGGNLSPAERREVQQAILSRQGMNGPGAHLGNAAAFEEALTRGTVARTRQNENLQLGLGWLSSGQSKGDTRNRFRQINQANKQGYIFGTPLAAQLPALSSQGSTPFTGSGISLDPNAGARGASFAQSNYGNLLNYQAQQVSPLGQIAGLAGGVGGLAGGFSGFFGK